VKSEKPSVSSLRWPHYFCDNIDYFKIIFQRITICIVICLISIIYVLGLARTGLLFTGIQEGTQPGGLTQPGQTEQGIPYHVLSCWGSGGGGAAWQELTRSLGACGGGPGEQLSVLQFVLWIPLIYIVVVPVPFVCCSVKLSLSRPTSFCMFLSILLRTAVGGGAAMWRFSCLPQPNHNNIL